MSYLSNAVARRRLVLFCVRLLLQCAMASSIPQTGTDEFELRCVPAADDTSAHTMVHNKRKTTALKSPAQSGRNSL
jgi:hypothetical protein